MRQPIEDQAVESPAHPGEDPRQLKVHRAPPQRDVPYVPTDDAVVAAMLRLVRVSASDVVYDLGCGDGRIVIAAARQHGARGVGVDIDPQRITECRENAKKAGVEGKVRFCCQSFFDTDLSEATVVTLYLLPSINQKLRPKLLRELKTGTRIIANHFGMGDWPPDSTADVHHRTLYQWIVPAWVQGRWKCIINDPDGRRHLALNLKRQYQTVTGTARMARREVQVLNGRLFGDQLTFKLPCPEKVGNTLRFSCVVEGTSLRGTCQVGTEGPLMAWAGTWQA